MDKMKILKAVNVVLIVSFMVQVFTVVVIFFHIKVADAHMIHEVHEYNGLLMVALALLHLALNWGWVKANLFKRKQV